MFIITFPFFFFCGVNVAQHTTGTVVGFLCRVGQLLQHLTRVMTSKC